MQKALPTTKRCQQHEFHIEFVYMFENAGMHKILTWAMAASLSARPNRKTRALSIFTGTVRPRHSTSLMVAACLVRAWVIRAYRETKTPLDLIHDHTALDNCSKYKQTF